MKSNNIYLENSLYKDALHSYCKYLLEKMEISTINIPTKDSLGYVLASPVFANSSSPNFTASAMDGIALNYELTIKATETNHLTLTKDIDYIVVDTGDYIPPNYNAVIMVEDLIEVDDNHVDIVKPIGLFENIRSIGEDIVQSQMILPSSHKIRPVDIGAMLAGGVELVEVLKPFNIGILPTGTEIVDVTKGVLDKGDIIDSNSYMLKALVEEMGLNAYVNDIVIDDYELLKKNIINLTENNDIVFINAGSSAGREDFTKDILEEIGEVVVHGVAIKPGKPVILAMVNNKMVVGIPGYPVACYMIFDKIIKPILHNLMKINQDEQSLQVSLIKHIYSSLKHLEFVRVKINYINGKFVATPLARGAGVSMSLVDCDGILEVPKEIEGYNAGDVVSVKLNKSVTEIKNRISCIGSHDLILDFMKDLFASNLHEESGFSDINTKIKLSSSHVGSFGGILALKNKECNLAPIHILDEQTGEYNIATVKQFFKDEKMVLIKGVKRLQGLIVQKGNPKNIRNIKDITNFKYINRQNGSGTNILLKYLMKENNISSENVKGYDFNVPTHFDVAINVKDGVADCGLGIYSVANSLDLDFINVASEDYDFLIFEKDIDNESIKVFLEVLKSDELKKQLENAGGYDVSNIGDIIFIG